MTWEAILGRAPRPLIDRAPSWILRWAHGRLHSRRSSLGESVDSSPRRSCSRLDNSLQLKVQAVIAQERPSPRLAAKMASSLAATNKHYLQVCRYVERNALRAGLVQRAEAWRWCSLWQRQAPDRPEKEILSDWRVSQPPDWLNEASLPQSKAELEAVRRV